MKIRPILAKAVAVVLATSTILGSPAPVLAACNPGRGSTDGAYQAGTVGTPSPYPRGVRADVDEYNPYFASNSLAGSLMSVMLSNVPYWAQLGWQKYKSGDTIRREIFIEHVDGFGNNTWMHWPGRPVGSVTNYKITFDASIKRFNYYVAGSLYAGLNANYTPIRYEIFGETHNTQDQMPGGYSAHAKFVNTYYTSSSTWTPWLSLTSPVHYYAPTARAQRVSSVRYDIWDLGCAS